MTHRLRNWLHSALLLAGMAAIAWVGAAAFGGPEAGVWALLGLLVAMLLAPTAPKTMLLSLYGAKPLTERDFPEGARLVRDLASRAGLPQPPTLYYIPSAVPNAFAVGGRSDSAVAVTDGMLRLLDRREFAGVLAHEISHVANRDLWIMGLADMMTRTTALLSYAGQFMLVLNLPLFVLGAATIPWTAVLVFLFAPTLMSLLQLALSRTREFDADIAAARLTGDPIGLAAALRKLERRTGRFWEEIVFPGRRMPNPSLLRTHPATDDRVARLRELAAADSAGRDGGDRPSWTAPPRIRPAAGPPRMRWHGVWW